MRVIDPGHYYELTSLDTEKKEQAEYLLFVKRESEGYPGNKGHHSGTTTQEVLRVLIDRTKYVDRQIHDEHNDTTLYHLRRAILQLELRAAKRHKRMLPLLNLDEIELQPVCEKCGHIGCGGECH